MFVSTAFPRSTTALDQGLSGSRLDSEVEQLTHLSEFIFELTAVVDVNSLLEVQKR